MPGSEREFGLAERFAALANADGPAFPQTELVTDRLRLRCYTEADIDAHWQMMSSEPVRRWSNAPHPYTREHAEQWCTREAAASRTTGLGISWAVVDRVSGQFVGMAALTNTNWQARVTEVAAMGAPQSLGQGFASEALRTISRWVLDDQRFHRLQIMAAVENHASRRVAEACGFVREGVLRNAGFTHRGPVDMVVFGLIPADLGIERPNAE